jgi:hypothetical protein
MNDSGSHLGGKATTAFGELADGGGSQALRTGVARARR